MLAPSIWRSGAAQFSDCFGGFVASRVGLCRFRGCSADSSQVALVTLLLRESAYADPMKILTREVLSEEKDFGKFKNCVMLIDEVERGHYPGSEGVCA